MHGPILIADRRDGDALNSLGRAILEWEPHLDLYLPPFDARLFEPDGTLYAVSLAPLHEVTFNRRERRIALGDMIVVPRGLALDVEPEVHMLGIRYDGPPPDHFRERFIQVWGLEHLPAPERSPPQTAGLGPCDVIPVADVRHRIAYAVWEIPAAPSPPIATGHDVALLIGLEGEARVRLLGLPGSAVLSTGLVATIGPGLAFDVTGSGRIGVVTLMTELAHQSRRLDANRYDCSPVSQEFHPLGGAEGSGRRSNGKNSDSL